ncbi:unnamed protein product, partial [Didymodactylos carnosus]
DDESDASHFNVNAKQEEISAPLENTNSSTSKDNSELESLPDSKTTLFINKTSLEIAQFDNANLLNDDAAYLGFESYETDNVFAWHYKRQNLIKNDWTLTGEYYLRLYNEIRRLMVHEITPFPTGKISYSGHISRSKKVQTDCTRVKY